MINALLLKKNLLNDHPFSSPFFYNVYPLSLCKAVETLHHVVDKEQNKCKNLIWSIYNRFNIYDFPFSQSNDSNNS
jgi:hypothetical protein